METRCCVSLGIHNVSMKHNRSARFRRRQWMTVAVIAIACVIANALVMPTIDSGDDDYGELLVMSIALGMMIGQINLISIWAALAPGRLAVRLPWALMLTVVMWAILCVDFFNEGVSTDALYQSGVILVCAQLAAQTPLWIGAKLGGWRLASRSQRKRGIEVAEAQFSIGHMLSGTLLLALALGLIRWTIAGRPAAWSNIVVDPHILVILVGATVTNLIIVVPAIWLAFVPTHQLWPTLMRWTLFVFLVSLAEVAILSTILWTPSSWLATGGATAMINLSQTGLVVTVLLVLRGMGYRLVRLKKR